MSNHCIKPSKRAMYFDMASAADASIKSMFEVLGYFEDVVDVSTGKCLGTRKCAEQPGRILGYNGQQQQTMTAPFELERGHKTIIVKASKEKPMQIRTTYLRLCGKLIRREDRQ